MRPAGSATYIHTPIFNQKIKGARYTRINAVSCLWKGYTSFILEPFLHLCASHFMKNAKRLVRKA